MLDLSAEQIYTIRPASSTEMEFVVMTQDSPFVGDRLARNSTMERVLTNGRADFNGLYPTVTGRWISAFAPIKNERSEVVALLEVDFPYDRFQAEFYYSMRPVAVGAFLLLILFVASSWIAHQVSRPLRGIAESVKPFAEGRGDLTMQLAVPGNDEIAVVADNIDRFLSSIAQSIREVKQFSAVVLKSSEEFRTAAA